MHMTYDTNISYIVTQLTKSNNKRHQLFTRERLFHSGFEQVVGRG